MTPKERLEIDPGNIDHSNKMAWAHKYKKSSTYSQTFSEVYRAIEDIIMDEFGQPRDEYDSLGNTLDSILDRMRHEILRPKVEREIEIEQTYKIK